MTLSLLFTFTGNNCPLCAGLCTGPGNNTLSITSYGSYVPTGGYPATEFIGVTSSLGGNTYMSVKIYDDCLFICGEGGERNDNNQKSIETIQIFPNPAKETVTILHPEVSDGLLTINSIVGSKMMEMALLGNSSVIDLSTFANGTYFVTINLGGRTVTKRFVKSN